jgi:hypothetical protein
MTETVTKPMGSPLTKCKASKHNQEIKEKKGLLLIQVRTALGIHPKSISPSTGDKGILLGIHEYS